MEMELIKLYISYVSTSSGSLLLAASNYSFDRNSKNRETDLIKSSQYLETNSVQIKF